ncbi:hypothetical protein AB833_31450 [Chromatiales bacterium (ex Bugula neritina AB1)]|nr:hypothetical protein AB833_31450 [Chromatiales bacterium (ex Bugula neritina AB1)]
MTGSQRNDNWGSAALFGIFIVGNEAVPEAEWWAMTPAHTSVHAARVTAGAPWASWNSNRDSVQLVDDLQHGADQFASMQLSAAVVGHSSSSFLGGKGWDKAIIARLAEVLGSELTISTNGLDCLAALKACGIHRPLLVLPPWFGPGIVTTGAQYFIDHGVSPAATLSLDPGSKWRHLAPESRYPQGFGFEQELDPLYRQIVNAYESPADGILIAGTGFRCVAIIDKLEAELDVPVVTANQASLWHSLRQSGNTAEVAGYGQLFTR